MLISDNVHLHLKTHVPLVDEITFHLVVTEDLCAAHKALKVPFTDECSKTGGECHIEQGAFDIYLFIDGRSLTDEYLGHEIHHCVNSILDRIGFKGDRDNDEMDARVAGYLHNWVRKKLSKNGQVIK